MKRFALVALAAVVLPVAASAQVAVKGYYRSNGTYVQPSYRSAPDNSTLNNYSTRGNVNPYTGQAGTRDPYASSGSSYGSSNSAGSSYGQRQPSCTGLYCPR